jgi:hypothetical protein
MATSFERIKYGKVFPAGTDDLEIEMAKIRTLTGSARIPHYENVRRLLWPQLDDHRWHCTCRDEILRDNAKVTVLLGPGSTGKTHEAAWPYLCEYMVFPEETCVLVSSTDLRGLRLRVWGEITMLWQQAIERFPYLPGHLIDSRIAIMTDSVAEDQFDRMAARDMRRAIIGVPCIQDKKYVGLAKFHGVKQKRMRLIADEASMMSVNFLKSFANLNNNPDFQAVVIGNPNDPLDPLGVAAEPVDGWTNHMEPDRTAVWDTKFMNGRCVNLIGTDSPNFDGPADKPDRYKYLIGRKKIAELVSGFGKDSFEYWSQGVGCMKVGQLARRVLNRDLCREHNASGMVVWKNSELTHVFSLDAAYGGDRCIGGHVTFGRDVDDKLILKCSPPQMVPVRVRRGEFDPGPEDQIALWIKDYCQARSIPPENVFHDSTGRGGLGTAIGRVWSSQCNPVDFGGSPTKRLVGGSAFIYDKLTQERRQVLCDEWYDRFITELWWTVRVVIEAGQMRGMPEDVIDEMCLRNWDKLKGKYAVETKEDMKERIGRSPDLGDWMALAVEGCRRMGFVIEGLENPNDEKSEQDYFDKEAKEWEEALQSKMLKHA